MESISSLVLSKKLFELGKCLLRTFKQEFFFQMHINDVKKSCSFGQKCVEKSDD